MKITSKNKLLFSIVIIGLLLFLMLYFLFSPFLPSNPTTSDLKKTGISVIKSLYSSIIYHADLNQLNNFQTRTNSKNGMMQVFVPKGDFLMGAEDGKASKNHPMHKVTLNSFWIDQVEVTNKMYEKCVSDNSCQAPMLLDPYYSKIWFESYPVVYINWQQASNYCKWAEGDLPTEAEWEKAARGIEGGQYPWGNEIPDARSANFNNNIGMLISAYTYQEGFSPYGALNMAGNAREWVKDWFNDTYYSRTPDNNPMGAPIGHYKSLRGGSYLDDGVEISSYNRFFHQPGSAGINRGFRCVTRDAG